MEAGKKAQKAYRNYSAEFKAGAVRLVLSEKRSVASVARDLGISDTNVYKWVHQARIDRGDGKSGELTTDERQRLKELEKENRVLRMERDILKKATAFFAKENA